MKIFCIEDNYPKDGNAEQVARLRQEAPVVCLKPDSSLLKGRKPFFVPTFMGRIGYGGQVVVRVSRLGKTVSERFAHRYYDALTVGVDFTATDVLERCCEGRLPWEAAKAFDGSAVVGDWVPVDKLLGVQRVRFRLDINGQTVQEDSTAAMLHRIDALVAHVSRFHTLKMGDLLFTGTPAGAGEIRVGDSVEGFLEDRPVLSFLCK